MDNSAQTKKCPHCQTDIPKKATKCPNCQSDLRQWHNRHPILTLLLVFLFFGIVISLFAPKDESSYKTSNPREDDVQAARNADATWQSSKAGQICKAHLTWGKKECDYLADKKVWVGMGYDMLVYLRGKPDHTNVSNYGSKNEFQYCWTDRTPSCFYDDNDDGIIDAYN